MWGAQSKRIKGMMDELIDHARKDVGKVNDPRAQALGETSAKVPTGLKKAWKR